MGERLSDAAALMALLQVPGAGNGVARSALRVARQLRCSLGTFVDMPARALLEALPPGADPTLARAIGGCTVAHRESAERLAARSEKAGVAFFTIDDAGYPANVRECLGERAPALLSAVGALALLETPRAAVVGARDVSDSGKTLARKCGRDAARAGRVVVSGGASGVDDAAQRGAVDAGGSIVVVLPQGLLTYRGAAYVGEALRARRALLLSACLPDTAWQQHAAVERNDVIAALSEAVCVIEPKKTGGSIRTARSALEYGRHVFVRCNADSQSVYGELVRAGALPLGDGDWLRIASTTPSKSRASQASLPGME